MRGRYFSGHLVLASFFPFLSLPAVRLGYVTENALTEKAWEEAVEGLGKVTRNSMHLANKSEAEGVAILPISTSVLYFTGI